MSTILHRTREELEAGLPFIREAPRDAGELSMIVRRPAVGEREELDSGELDVAEGLRGDNWRVRGSSRTEDGSAHPDMQLNIMATRVLALLAGERERWRLAGDQLIIDMDFSPANLPPGTRLTIGDAIIEITSQPHTGCAKFVQRFGRDAAKFVNSPLGRDLRLRGLCARVVRAGTIRRGDVVRKADPDG